MNTQTNRVVVGLLVSSGGCFLTGYVCGQPSPLLTPSQRAFVDANNKVQYDDYGFDDLVALAEAYRKAPNNVEVVSQIIRSAQAERVRNPTVNLLCLQVAQNQKLIEQNDAILAALKARKP